MVDFASLTFVFVAGFITALATGLGAIPFFFVEDVGDRWNVALWGVASGIMVSASVFGLVLEAFGTYVTLSFDGLVVGAVPPRLVGLLVVGLSTGVFLVVVAHRIIDDYEVSPKRYEEADFKKLLLILGILTVHSFPEGVAVGVAFADLGFSGPTLFGFVVPVLGIFMTVAISIHNVPEGLAISIPLRAMGVSEWRMVWWAVFSSLPQPVGAVIAFYFVRLARDFLPFGFGFAAGAMIYLVLTEFIPEALELGRGLPGGGKRELLAGLAAGFAVMVPLAFL
ncbi:ZIP family metal transporter [Salinigranum marinum]|uniref:ZIP family metal transporter n=1 Tax=Salinigranum marinum TaxID=1515595 RepID=UPI002989A51D|nr:ZIP family metal transporter [Salinigranum marinum]